MVSMVTLTTVGLPIKVTHICFTKNCSKSTKDVDRFMWISLIQRSDTTKKKRIQQIVSVVNTIILLYAGLFELVIQVHDAVYILRCILHFKIH